MFKSCINFRPARRAAFTLIEILLVLALIGMVTGVFVVGATHLMDKGPSSPAEVFWTAATAARKQALMSGREVRLAYVAPDTKEGASVPAGLVATWESGGQSFFPFTNMGDVICDFLSTQKGMSSIMIAGQVVETQTMSHITFYGDGTCTPCRIQIRVNGSTGSLAIDPWTCAEMLVPKEGAR